MQSTDGISSGDNLATDMNGSWTFDIVVEDRSENISITFRAHNLPEDTWSDNHHNLYFSRYNRWLYK